MKNLTRLASGPSARKPQTAEDILFQNSPSWLQDEYRMTKVARRDQARSEFKQRVLMSGQGQPVISGQLGGVP